MSVFAYLIYFTALNFNYVVNFSSENIDEHIIHVKEDHSTFFSDSTNDFLIKVLDEKNNTVEDFSDIEEPILYNFFDKKGSILITRKSSSAILFSYSLFNSNNIYANGIEHRCSQKIFVRSLSGKVVFGNNQKTKNRVTNIKPKTGNVCFWLSETSEKKFILKMSAKNSYLYIPETENKFSYIHGEGVKYVETDQLSFVFNSAEFDNSSFVEIGKKGLSLVNQYLVDFTDSHTNRNGLEQSFSALKVSRKALAKSSSTIVLAVSIVVGVVFYIILLVPTIILLNMYSKPRVESEDGERENETRDDEDLTRYAHQAYPNREVGNNLV